jgi:hypothetical protein
VRIRQACRLANPTASPSCLRSHGGQADEDLRAVLDILAGNKMRRKHHPLSGPQVPDVATDRLNHAHTVGAGRELRRCFIVTATGELLASNSAAARNLTGNSFVG